jgi:hypothetical protein
MRRSKPAAPVAVMNQQPMPSPAPTKMTQYLSAKKLGAPIVRVDSIRYLRSAHYDSSDSDSSSSCSTTTRGRRRFRKRPLVRILSSMGPCRSIESCVMEVMIGKRNSSLPTNAAAIQQDDDSSFSSLSSYETGSESESEDEEICLRKITIYSNDEKLVDLR